MPSPSPQNTCRLVGQTPMHPQGPCRRPTHDIPSRGQQHTTPTINSVGAALLSSPKTPYSGPESPQSRMEVFLHSLSKLLPCLSFCLSDHLSCMPLGLPVPVSCFWSPTGQKGLITLLLRPDSIPYRQCPPAGSRVAAATGTNYLATTALISHLNNGGTEHDPLGLNVPHLHRNMFEVLPEVRVKAPPNRRLRQTFPTDPHNTFGPARLYQN
ncbi:uncharacterized protein LOC112451521 [Kryptolebias marmoratus]|uniref:uncharacterized protein LOC112451521 n=1 Tax=Kryptolebias marmoratus TaxID=37003 RepID=UPI0018AC9A40|nr:uncharacterized protein LOC112451521 [Kryptolebias marmoratus]